MSLSTIKTEAEDFLAKLRADATHLYDEGKSLFAKLLGEAETDAADVEQQAKDAATPVVQAVESDAGTLAHDAVTQAEADLGGGSKPSA